MSLVAYYSETDSDNEHDESSGTVLLLKAKQQESSINKDMVSANDSKSNSNNEFDIASFHTRNGMFLNLPKPRDTSQYIKEEDDEFLRKKEIPTETPAKPKQSIKIGVPSLSEFDEEDDEPTAKRMKPSKKAFGLFAILPPPKSSPISTKMFVPNVVSNRTAINNKIKNIPKKPSKVAPLKQIPRFKLLDSDDDDDEPIEMFDDDIWKQLCGRKLKKSPKIIENEILAIDEETAIDIVPAAPEPYNGLDNEAFKQLVGSSKIRRENIKLIDINEEEVLPDEDIWMSKALTDPECKPKPAPEEAVNEVARRKHHITYLAQKAKADEHDLKNQWAASRFTRQQTSAKYGF